MVETSPSNPQHCGRERIPRPAGRANVDYLSYPPRGLSREEAARYVGVSATKFDALVKDGRMPPPKRIDGRVVWDRRRLDEKFDELDDSGHNPWD